MFRINLYKLRACKEELEEEYFQIRALLLELDSLAGQIKRNMFVSEVRLQLDREKESLDLRLSELKQYILALEKIICTCERQENSIISQCEGLQDEWKGIRLKMNYNIFLNRLLKNIIIE